MADLIYRLDDLLESAVCNDITNYIISNKDGKISKFGEGVLPWTDNDTIPWKELDHLELKDKIDKFRIQLTEIVSSRYNKQYYPHYTDIVIWRAGRKMSFHKDDGYGNDGLDVRKISTVTYLNEDFLGGETVIKKNDTEEYVSTPKIGSTVMFKSNEECLHKVNKILSGKRITLAIWFTDDEKYLEQ